MNNSESRQNEFDPKFLAEYYKKLYIRHKHDSPDFSRTSMIRRIATYAKSTEEKTDILNIGSGPQSIERQLLSGYKNQFWLRNLHLYSLDIATIDALLCKFNSKVNHVQASGLELPFCDNAFDLAISNHAIDFLPHIAFSETARVLKPNAEFIFYFHHPDMLLSLDDAHNQDVQTFWQYLIDKNILFKLQAIFTTHCLPTI